MRRKHILLPLLGIGILAAALLVAWPRPQAKHLYRVTILPTLGGLLTTPTAINNRGEIVGYSEAADGSCHLCLWDPNGQIQDLGPALRTRYYLNDAGQIAGITRDPNGNQVAFIRDCAGGVRTLGTLGGTESVARGLNNRGQVVGWSRTAEGLKHAFVWDSTIGMQDLAAPEGDGGEARAINDRGQIIGVSEGRTSYPNLWTPAGSAWITEPLEGLFGGSGINNKKYTVGRQRLSRAGEFMVRWRPGDPTILFPIEYPIVDWPVINDANQLLFTEWHHRFFQSLTLGRLLPSPIENYLWDPDRGRIPLNPYVLTKRGETFEAFDLNNRGCIVGRVVGHDWTGAITYVRPVLLEPVPQQWQKR